MDRSHRRPRSTKPTGRYPNGADVLPYVRSKTLAERAAWDFIAKDGRSLELSVVNPVGVFGPALGPDYSTSILIVQRLMDGTIPGLPRIAFGVVDVRDVADLHLRAMTDPAAKGERFLAVAGNFMSMREMASFLKGRMGASARRVQLPLPDWLVRIVTMLNPAAKQPSSLEPKEREQRKGPASPRLGTAVERGGHVATAESLVRWGSCGTVTESRRIGFKARLLAKGPRLGSATFAARPRRNHALRAACGAADHPASIGHRRPVSGTWSGSPCRSPSCRLALPWPQARPLPWRQARRRAFAFTLMARVSNPVRPLAKSFVRRLVARSRSAALAKSAYSNR